MNTSVMSPPGLHRLIKGAYEATYERVGIALKAAGFEIMAEINLADFLAKKSQMFVHPYKIIVVCNSDIAHRALTIAPDVGVMLPCHVAVLQIQDDQVEVRVADPHIIWNTASHTYLKPIAEELNTRLERVIDALKG
ncbi:MAG: DUF302 domain-containing protein [Anaerolineae bacterium]|nr:DUF302 domain-containing protein [Anaerolineae bacterium]